MSDEQQIATLDPDYRIVADRQLQIQIDLALKYQSFRFEMAKWLFASLLSINFGALALTYKNKNSSVLFFVGIVAAVLAGFSIYLNLDRLERGYWASIDPKMLVARQFWKSHKDAATTSWVGRTHTSGIVFGILSLSLFVIGGAIVAWSGA